MKISKWTYLYAALWGLWMGCGALIVSAAMQSDYLTGAVFGLIMITLGLFLPLAVFVGLVARRLDVLAETGKDVPPLGRQPQ
jgi:hypothetical protein